MCVGSGSWSGPPSHEGGQNQAASAAHQASKRCSSRKVHVGQTDLDLFSDRELVEAFKVFILCVQRFGVREVVANTLRTPGPLELADRAQCPGYVSGQRAQGQPERFDRALQALEEVAQ